MSLKNLAHVHPAGNAEGVKNHVDRSAILEERHVFGRQDLGDNTLVAVATCELVSLGDLSLLRDVDAHQTVDTRRELVALVDVEHANADDLAGLTVGHLERGVAHFARLLAKDCAQQALFRRQFGLALGCDLADQNVTRDDIRTDADDAALVEVGEHLFGHVGDIAGDLLGAQLRVAGVNLMLLDVDRGQHVVLHKALVEDDRILVVVAFP